ncbi:MAG: carboxypeptidase-like regulatory domain-containing protein [Myxococcota bacterium]
MGRQLRGLRALLRVRGLAIVAVCGWLAVAGCTAGTPFSAPPSGQVTDAATGAPIAGAIVVFRYDRQPEASGEEVEALAHREIVTDRAGRFRAPRLAWSWPGAVRIASVWAPGYRCSDTATSGRIPLQRAKSLEERRASCVPVAGTPREVPRYRAAWQSLYPSIYRRSVRRPDAEVERVLSARRVFGFGANCEGPVVDLALSRDGRRVAYWVRRAGLPSTIRIQELGEGLRSVGESASEEVSAPVWSPELELAWTARHELVLWQPHSTHPPEVVPTLGDDTPQTARVLWKPPTPPAAPALAPARPGEAPRGQPLAADDLRDANDARGSGRRFLRRSILDPRTGLPADVLETEHTDGGRSAVALPGEACGAPGRFGRPEDHLTAAGTLAVDLRYVSGGCRPLLIDLRDGRFRPLDPTVGAVCRETRAALAPRFEDALRGYSLEVQRALAGLGADPTSAYVIRIAPDGTAVVRARDPLGRQVEGPLPRFPLRTPLRELRISVVGGVPLPGRSVPGIQPL